jgi:hypothetical protein
MSRHQGEYTEEQLTYEIEERAQQLVPKELQEEFTYQRQYVVEASEGRIPSTPARDQYWQQKASNLVHRFVTTHQHLLTDEPEPQTAGLPEELIQDLSQAKMTSNNNDMAILMAEAFKQALLHVESHRSSQPLQVPRPDTFDGGRSASAVEGWLRSIERYAVLTKISEFEKVKFAATLMRGRAETWLRRLEAESTLPAEWHDFKNSVIKAFKPVHSVEMARDKLAVLNQTGSVESYVDAFQNLSLEIPDLSPAEAKDRFIRGLQPSIRAYVRTQVPDSLDKAFHLAMAYEGGLGTATSSGHNAPRPPVSIGYDHSASMDLDIAQTRFRRQRNPRTFFDADIRCFNCNGQGHVQRNCSSPRRPRQFDGNPRLARTDYPDKSQTNPFRNKANLNVVTDERSEVNLGRDSLYIQNLSDNKDMKLPLYDVVCDDGRILRAILGYRC